MPSPHAAWAASIKSLVMPEAPEKDAPDTISDTTPDTFSAFGATSSPGESDFTVLENVFLDDFPLIFEAFDCIAFFARLMTISEHAKQYVSDECFITKIQKF